MKTVLDVLALVGCVAIQRRRIIAKVMPNAVAHVVGFATDQALDEATQSCQCRFPFVEIFIAILDGRDANHFANRQQGPWPRSKCFASELAMIGSSASVDRGGV